MRRWPRKYGERPRVAPVGTTDWRYSGSVIRSLRGNILSVEPPNVVVDVNGIGYLVSLTENHAALLSPGQEVQLDTVLVVRDDGFTLFGFADDGQRTLFDALTAVSGVGPRLAMAVLNTLTPAQISHAVLDEDDKPFRSVSGIGPKMAKLIVVSLAGRVALIAADDEPKAAPADSAIVDEVVSALVGLGWRQDAAVKAVTEVAAPGKSVALTLREALVVLGGTRG